MPRARNPARRRAERLVRNAGVRATETRLDVLTALLGARRALSHRELETAINGTGKRLDRVTLYRVLDWLTERGLTHRIAGADRVWRFNAESRPRPRHAHFHCSRCGRVFCLDAAPAPARPRVPRGFHLERIETTLRGACAHCNAT